MSDATDATSPEQPGRCASDFDLGGCTIPDCPVHSPNLELRVCQHTLGCTAAFTHHSECPQLLAATLGNNEVLTLAGTCTDSSLCPADAHLSTCPLGKTASTEGCTERTDCTAGTHILGCPSRARGEGVEVTTLAGATTTWPERPLPEDTAGVWFTYRRVAGVAVPLAPYADELSALRAALTGGAAVSGVVWWPLGTDWAEVNPHAGVHMAVATDV